MKIAIGSDNAGFGLKEFLKGKLMEAGYEVEDLGTLRRVQKFAIWMRRPGCQSGSERRWRARNFVLQEPGWE